MDREDVSLPCRTMNTFRAQVYTNVWLWTLHALFDNKALICSDRRLTSMSNKVKLLRGSSLASLVGRWESKLYSCEAQKTLDPEAKILHSDAKVFCDQPKAFLSGTNDNAYSFSTLNVTVPSPFVYNVELNRPKKMNALNKVGSSLKLVLLSRSVCSWSRRALL